MTLLTVYVRFMGARNFKWPLRPGDYLELWSPSHELVGELDATLLLEVLATYLRMARTVQTLGEHVTLDTLFIDELRLGLPDPPRKPPVKIILTAERRAAYRAQRKRRARARRAS
jgi:hypothetical protein